MLKGIFNFTPMLVCMCHPLSSDQLDQLIEDGADSVEEIGRRCGAGTDCGACLDELAEAVEQGAEASAGVDSVGRSMCNRLVAGLSAGRARCSTALVSVRSRPLLG